MRQYGHSQYLSHAQGNANHRIREEFCGRLCGCALRPQEVNCGQWLTALRCLLSPKTFQPSTPIALRRIRACASATGLGFTDRVIPNSPPFISYSRITSTATSDLTRSASSVRPEQFQRQAPARAEGNHVGSGDPFHAGTPARRYFEQSAARRALHDLAGGSCL